MFCGRFSLSVRCSNWPPEMGPSRPAQGDFGPVGQSCNTSVFLRHGALWVLCFTSAGPAFIDYEASVPSNVKREFGI